MAEKDTYTESRKEVLAHAVDAGYEVSGHQLERWQGVGLLPRPRQVGLGRGQGTQVFYPTGTAEQLRALCAISKQHRTLEKRGWKLWWQGFPVDDQYWRPVLQDAAAMFDQRKADLLNPDDLSSDKAQDVIDSFSDAKMQSKTMRQMRKRVGSSSFPTVVSFALQTLTGTFVGMSTTNDDDRKTDLAILKKGVGSAEEFEEKLGQISAVIPDSLVSVLASTTDTDIFFWRDFLRKIIHTCHAIENPKVDINVREIHVLGSFGDESPKIQAMLLVFLISLKSSIFPGF